jgi:magnesium transporter
MAIPQVKSEKKQLNLKVITWGDITWVDIVPPTKAEIEYLAENYKFHHLDLDDCLSRKQLPKLDEYLDYLFLIFHFSTWDKVTRVSTTGQLSAFVGENFLITLHRGELKTLVKLFHECEISEEARQENFSQGSGYLLYNIIDRAVDSYFPILDKILSWVEEVEDSVFDENIEAAHELSVLRRDIITQRRIILRSRSLINELGHKLGRFTKADITVHFGDLTDHMNKIRETLDECREVIEVFKDTDFLLSSHRLNRVTRILAIVSAIILPFLVVSGLYGMNVMLPGGINQGSPHTFISLLAILFATVGILLYFFHRKRLI